MAKRKTSRRADDGSLRRPARKKVDAAAGQAARRNRGQSVRRPRPDRSETPPSPPARSRSKSRQEAGSRLPARRQETVAKAVKKPVKKAAVKAAATTARRRHAAKRPASTVRAGPLERDRADAALFARHGPARHRRPAPAVPRCARA